MCPRLLSPHASSSCWPLMFEPRCTRCRDDATNKCMGQKMAREAFLWTSGGERVHLLLSHPAGLTLCALTTSVHSLPASLSMPPSFFSC
jgi:hypothetical protein